MLPALHRNGCVVIGEQHAGAEAIAQLRIEGEPGDCNNIIRLNGLVFA